MGKIEYVGIINDFVNSEIETSIEIPENAHSIDENNWIDAFNPLNYIMVGIPIFLIILLIMGLKQRKNGIFNKEVREESIKIHQVKGRKKIILTALKRFGLIILIFGVGNILITPIHELLHCIAGALVGLDMKFGFDPQSLIAFAYTEDPLTKAQFLVMSLAPFVILGIIPLIILFAKYPKEKMNFIRALKYWLLTCFIGGLLMSCGIDIIQSYNYIKNIPNDAIVLEDYWYIPNNK